MTGLTNESAHNFEVRAVNANGNGLVASDTATPMSTVPDTPMNFGVTSSGPTEIALSWTAVDGASSYHIQRRTNGGTWGSPMDVGSGTTYTDMDLAPSTTYDYEVRAVNAAGSSQWSAVVTAATTAPEAPDAVSDLAAIRLGQHDYAHVERARQQRRRHHRLLDRGLRRRLSWQLERSRHQGRDRDLA